MRLINRNQYVKAIAILAVGVLALLLVPSKGMAVSACPNLATDICNGATDSTSTSDCDGDGITDYHECQGLPSSDVDPSKPDLFYALTDEEGTDLTLNQHPDSLVLKAIGPEGNALQFYADSTTGVKVRTHKWYYASTIGDRLLFQEGSLSTARVALIVESFCISNCEGTYLGSTEQSVPTDPDVSTTIYSQKIKNNVYENCGNKPCTVAGSPNITAPDEIVSLYILQVISHEMGHGSLLAPSPDGTAKNYYHYRRSGTVMDPSVSFSKGVFTIPTVFQPQDAEKVQLN